jgi:hypothetical protein
MLNCARELSETATTFHHRYAACNPTTVTSPLFLEFRVIILFSQSIVNRADPFRSIYIDAKSFIDAPVLEWFIPRLFWVIPNTCSLISSAATHRPINLYADGAMARASIVLIWFSPNSSFLASIACTANISASGTLLRLYWYYADVCSTVAQSFNASGCFGFRFAANFACGKSTSHTPQFWYSPFGIFFFRLERNRFSHRYCSP